MRGNVISLSHNLLGCYLTAKCGDCVSEQNSVRFVCCGKLKTDEFKQNDERWKYELYNTTTPTYQRTIGEVGCALTSMATLINYYAKTFPELNISITDPKNLNEKLKPNGFDKEHNISFSIINSSVVSNSRIEYINYPYQSKYDDQFNRNKLKQLINFDIQNGLPVIVKIHRSKLIYNKINNTYKKKEWSHFMIVVGKCGNKYIVSDPGSSRKILLDPDVVEITDQITQNTYGPLIGIRRFRRR